MFRSSAPGRRTKILYRHPLFTPDSIVSRMRWPFPVIQEKSFVNNTWLPARRVPLHVEVGLLGRTLIEPMSSTQILSHGHQDVEASESDPKPDDKRRRRVRSEECDYPSTLMRLAREGQPGHDLKVEITLTIKFQSSNESFHPLL